MYPVAYKYVWWQGDEWWIGCNDASETPDRRLFGGWQQRLTSPQGGGAIFVLSILLLLGPAKNNSTHTHLFSVSDTHSCHYSFTFTTCRLIWIPCYSLANSMSNSEFLQVCFLSPFQSCNESISYDTLFLSSSLVQLNNHSNNNVSLCRKRLISSKKQQTRTTRATIEKPMVTIRMLLITLWPPSNVSGYKNGF